MFQRNATATLRPLSNHRSVKSGPECLRLDLAIILGPIGSDWHSVRQVQDVLLMASKNMENHGKSEIAFQWVSTRYNNYPPNMTNSKAVVLRLILLLSVFVCACVLRALWAEVATLLCIYLTLNASYLQCPLLELFLAAQGWGILRLHLTSFPITRVLVRVDIGRWLCNCSSSQRATNSGRERYQSSCRFTTSCRAFLPHFVIHAAWTWTAPQVISSEPVL